MKEKRPEPGWGWKVLCNGLRPVGATSVGVMVMEKAAVFWWLLLKRARQSPERLAPLTLV